MRHVIQKRTAVCAEGAQAVSALRLKFIQEEVPAGNAHDSGVYFHHIKLQLRMACERPFRPGEAAAPDHERTADGEPFRFCLERTLEGAQVGERRVETAFVQVRGALENAALLQHADDAALSVGHVAHEGES